MLARLRSTGAPTGRRARGAALLATLALVASLSACEGAAGPEDEKPDAAGPAVSSTPTVPPTPAEQLGLAEGWGPDRAELERAARIVRRMPLPDLAGQVIVAQWRGVAAPVQMVRDLHLGGVIAFDSNVVSAAQITGVNAALSTQVRRKWPLFLGVDQEGGVVERMRGALTRFPTFMSAGAAADPALTRRAYAASGKELRGLGFTVDFAPDADVTSGPGDPTIGSRSVSSRPAAVAEQVIAATTGFSASGVVPVIKHFPGHGSVPADSHLTLPVQTKSRQDLETSDLVPFRRAVEAGVPAVMVGHLDVRAIDPQVPSSLSRAVVTDLLRDELGFDGLVVTDSLAMAAVTRGRDPGRTAVQALRAGADVLLMPPSPAAARGAIVRAVRAGNLSRRRLEQAAARQIALLTHLAGAKGAPVGSALTASRRLSAAAVTVTDGECSGRLVGGVRARLRRCRSGRRLHRGRREGRPDRPAAPLAPDRADPGHGAAHEATQGAQAGLRRTQARLGEGRGQAGTTPREVERCRGGAARGRHAGGLLRVPRRPGRRHRRRRHGQPVGAGSGQRPDPDRDLRRHACCDGRAGRGPARHCPARAGCR